jgi:hypothetical protein
MIDRRTRTVRLLLVLGIALGLGACGLFKTRATNDAQQRYVLEVDNHNFYDATISVTDQGSRRRIGVVTGLTSKKFEFDWPKNALAFEIDLIGGGKYFTSSLPVSPGDVLGLRVRPDLHRLRPGYIPY